MVGNFKLSGDSRTRALGPGSLCILVHTCTLSVLLVELGEDRPSQDAAAEQRNVNVE